MAEEQPEQPKADVEADHEEPLASAENKLSEFAKMKNVRQSSFELMKKYDSDGDGDFDKSEVLNIIHDLKSEFNSNEQLRQNNLMLKRILIGAIVFFFLLIASIFGLSFAVASLTKETSTNSKGQLFTADGSQAIATDSRADLFVVETVDDVDCLTLDAVEAIKEAVHEGHNVLVQQNQDETGHHYGLESLQANGATYDEDTGKACFPIPNTDGHLYCLMPFKEGNKCNTSPESRRRLKLDDDLIEDNFNNDVLTHKDRTRKLGKPGGCSGNNPNCQATSACTETNDADTHPTCNPNNSCYCANAFCIDEFRDDYPTCDCGDESNCQCGC